jgi:hypothetical protein
MNPRDRCTVADDRIEAIWRESWIGSHLRLLVARVQTAWMESRCRRALATTGLID